MERDKHVFHYTTAATAFELILPERQLRMSPYSDVNDPQENKGWLFTAGGWGEEKADRHFELWRRFHESALHIWFSAKLLALSRDAPSPPDTVQHETWDRFSRGWARPRMWDRYGDRHAGVCLVFDYHELQATLSSELGRQGLARPYHKPVEYTLAGPMSERPSLDLDALNKKLDARTVAEFIERHHETLFFLKSDDWATEQEYRFVVTAPDDPYVFVRFDDALKAVIVGEKFPAWQETGAIEVCDAVDAQPLQIDWSMGRPFARPLRTT